MSDAKFSYDMRSIDDLPEVATKKRMSLLNGMADYMLKATRTRFRACKSPDGKTWPDTQYKGKGKGKRSVRTLYGRGHLFRSIVKYFKNQWAVAVGSGLIYANVHNEGVVFRASKKQSAFLFYNVFKKEHGENAKFSFGYKIKIPQRKFLGINEADSQAMSKLVEFGLWKGLQNG